uniref:Helicase-associated domain-containing protein n=1 Tax=Odontella aurita TaxID=265563 RepID=A0A7S4N9C8_9STRA|mmetsp:Transcript_54202/g.162293  ORF Transcript_54202/g.162293 Transcript_54202/m.162293 type:complete len:898 (+) Transcript_54202:137-2830(+)
MTSTGDDDENSYGIDIDAYRMNTAAAAAEEAGETARDVVTDFLLPNEPHRNQNSLSPRNTSTVLHAGMTQGGDGCTGQYDGPKRRRHQRLPLNSRREQASSYDTIRKKAVRVEWFGSIALGTFPVDEADDKYARAKALIDSWRSTMDPKPTREWVMRELERLQVRVVTGGHVGRGPRKRVSAGRQNDEENEGVSEDEDGGMAGDVVDVGPRKTVSAGGQDEGENGGVSEDEGGSLADDDVEAEASGLNLQDVMGPTDGPLDKDKLEEDEGSIDRLADGSESKDDGRDQGEDQVTETAPKPEVPPLVVPKKLFSDPSDSLAELYELLDTSLEEQADAAAELTEARRNLEDAKKWLSEAEEQIQRCAENVQTRTEKMWEGELNENCTWNFMYARLRNFREEHGHTYIGRSKKIKAESNSQQRKRRKMDRNEEEKEDDENVEGEAVNAEREGDSEEESDDSDSGEGKIGADERELGNWLTKQRDRYKYGKMKTQASHRVRALEELGVVWDLTEAKWVMMYRKLKDFYEKHGHTNVPCKQEMGEIDSSKGNRDRNEIELGKWLRKQRNRYRTGKLSADRVYDLEQLGIVWDLREAKWSLMYSRLEQFHKKHGHINISCKQETDDVISGEGNRINDERELALWLRKQRDTYRNGSMKSRSPHHVHALELLGIEWNQREEKWIQTYNKLVDFKRVHGHVDVSSKHSQPLHDWVNTQRAQARANLDRARKGEQRKSSAALTMNELAERVRLLEEIGFNWTPRDKSWDDHFAALCAYREMHGHCDVPEKYSPDPKLGHWVRNQRKFYRRQEYISEERIHMLESIGFRWHNFRKTWDERFEELLAFKAQFGHLTVSRCGEYKALALWMRTQKGYFTKYQRGERAPITEDQIEKLIYVGLFVGKPMG